MRRCNRMRSIENVFKLTMELTAIDPLLAYLIKVRWKPRRYSVGKYWIELNEIEDPMTPLIFPLKHQNPLPPNPPSWDYPTPTADSPTPAHRWRKHLRLFHFLWVFLLFLSLSLHVFSPSMLSISISFFFFFCIEFFLIFLSFFTLSHWKSWSSPVVGKK